MTCQRKAEWCANFLSTWKVQKSAFHCFVINPQLAPGGLRMPISILCFGKGPCAAALRLRPFISRLKGEAGRGEEEEQFQRHTLVCQSRPSKTFSYEKKIFHQCIISDSWAWAFNEIFSTADLWWWSMRCIGNHWNDAEKNFCQAVFYLPPCWYTLDDLSWFIAMATRVHKSWHWPKLRETSFVLVVRPPCQLQFGTLF